MFFRGISQFHKRIMLLTEFTQRTFDKIEGAKRLLLLHKSQNSTVPVDTTPRILLNKPEYFLMQCKLTWVTRKSGWAIRMRRHGLAGYFHKIHLLLPCQIREGFSHDWVIRMI